MKKLLILVPALAVALVAFGQDVYQPMPSSAKPYQGHGGGGFGKAKALNDLELTAIARASEAVGTQNAVVLKARQEVVAASLAAPLNPGALAAKLQAMADAEYALAIARAETFAKVKAELKLTAPEKIEAIKTKL